MIFYNFCPCIELATFQNIGALLMSTHNLCLGAEIRKIMYTHVNSSFTYKIGVGGKLNYMDDYGLNVYTE